MGQSIIFSIQQKLLKTQEQRSHKKMPLIMAILCKHFIEIISIAEVDLFMYENAYPVLIYVK